MGAQLEKKSFGIWRKVKTLYTRGDAFYVVLDPEGKNVNEEYLKRHVVPRGEGEGFYTTSKFSTEEYYYLVGQELKIKDGKRIVGV